MIMIGINEDAKKFVDGVSVRLIKPKYIDENTIEINQGFRMIKIKPIEANVKAKKIKQLKDIGSATSSSASSAASSSARDLMTFQELDKIPANTEAFNLTFKVSSISRSIDGKYSKFKLATITDRQNMQNNLAVYPPHLESLTPGKIYKMSVVKKSNYKKEDEIYNRLSTVKKASIKEFDDKNEAFKDVTTGEFVLTGMILGHGDIHEYKACKISWM